jgi:hypothetical protein
VRVGELRIGLLQKWQSRSAVTQQINNYYK